MCCTAPAFVGAVHMQEAADGILKNTASAMSCDVKQDFSRFTPRQKRGFSDSFTLLELLVVVGILSVLGTVTFVALNPVETLKKTRDEQRYQELTTLDKAAHMYEADAQSISEGSANVVYISLPDTSSSCASWTLPPLPSGQAYHCVISANLYNVDGTGWVPIAFSSISYGTPLTKLPTDPTNNATYYYTYMTSGNGAGSMFTALAEAQSHDPAIGDGGRMPGVYEKGGNLALGPFDRDQGLVGYWTLNEGSGTTVYDYSGKGNNGTLNGSVAWVSGGKLGGYAIQTDGSTNYVSIPSRPSVNSWTISVWGNATSLANTRNALFGVIQYGTLNFKVQTWGLEVTADGNSYVCTNSGGYCGPATFATGVWYLYTIACDSNTNKATIWVNGTFQSTQNGSPYSCSQLYNNLSPLYFGSGNSGFTQSYAGMINDFRIYNRALSASEVQAIYSATK